MVRFLLNENISGTVIRVLRERGHDVVSAKETLRGASDEEILAKAQLEQRILATQDKDFGELAFRVRLPASCGVILFRLAGTDHDQDNRRILEVLESDTNWVGPFAVVTQRLIRIRPLPSPKRSG
jgi:predicted nuclease of predicted toxin-antitoxin system